MSVHSLIGEQQLHFMHNGLLTISGTQCISCIHTDHINFVSIYRRVHKVYIHQCYKSIASVLYIVYAMVKHCCVIIRFSCVVN